jgi:hypothetical protein
LAKNLLGEVFVELRKNQLAFVHDRTLQTAQCAGEPRPVQIDLNSEIKKTM